MFDYGRWISLGFFVALFVIALVIELATTNLFTLITALSAAISAVIAGVSPFHWALLLIEIGVFTLSWVFWYLLLFRWFKHKNKNNQHPDLHLIGKEVILKTEASNVDFIPKYGTTRIYDVDYLVLPIDPVVIPANSVVKVIKTQGVTLLVKSF